MSSGRWAKPGEKELDIRGLLLTCETHPEYSNPDWYLNTRVEAPTASAAGARWLLQLPVVNPEGHPASDVPSNSTVSSVPVLAPSLPWALAHSVAACR